MKSEQEYAMEYTRWMVEHMVMPDGSDEGFGYCPRCKQEFWMDARDIYDWAYGRRWHDMESSPAGQLLCLKCRKDVGFNWRGKYEKDEEVTPEPEPVLALSDVERVERFIDGCRDSGIFEVHILDLVWEFQDIKPTRILEIMKELSYKRKDGPGEDEIVPIPPKPPSDCYTCEHVMEPNSSGPCHTCYIESNYKKKIG